MAQVFIGAFYGLPLFPASQAPSQEQLHSLEERLLAHYYLHRDSLTSALLSCTSQQGQGGVPGTSQQYEEKVSVEYQHCFRTQVSLARLRHFIRTTYRGEAATGDKLGGRGGGGCGAFRLPEESDIDHAHHSISKLSKMVGCLVDTLLSLNVDSAERRNSPEVSILPPTTSSGGSGRDEREAGLEVEDEGLGVEVGAVGDTQVRGGLSEEECRVLFYTLCIHGIPKMHARAIALLIKYCGSQPWWGRFLVEVASELFGAQQTNVFNKER